MRSRGQAYARLALDQVPRLLGNQDRNPYSPTYGCFHRDYWLDKTSDFPDAVRQFAVQALALVYKHDFPGNIYQGSRKVRDWAVAGLEYWTTLQHRDGSFDEFYPYERGWVGPSAFTTYTSIEAFKLLRDEMPPATAEKVLAAIRRAAFFIAAGESEEDHLANHHAMACLAVRRAYELLGDPALASGYDELWQGFLGYHHADEGWSREYDGIDPGYLSATISFLAKIYKTHPSDELFEVLRRSVECSSYFVYPNGFYAGSLGSRNTLHFYPHGYEILARQLPLAAAMAEKMLAALDEGKLVTPGIMSDRYVVYRVPEFLEAYLDAAPRGGELAPLPYEREAFVRYLPRARVFIANRSQSYTVANLAKGGVVKVFDRRDGRLVINDCGLLGRTESGRVVTSQWIDPGISIRHDDTGWQLSGTLQAVPSNKLFTPFKHIVFRTVLLAVGWHPRLAHLLKGKIRRTLILGQRPVPVAFERRFEMKDSGSGDSSLVLTDVIRPRRKIRFSALSVGDEFFVRYVPQSRYFQSQELEVEGHRLDEGAIGILNSGHGLEIRQIWRSGAAGPEIRTRAIATAGTVEPLGVYGVDYFDGRQRSRQLVYRLRRRTDEVAAALERHRDGRLRTVVDVGTADGLMLEALGRRVDAERWIGLDLSLPLLGATRSGTVSKIRADALGLPLRPAGADAVISTAVIEHVPDARAMLAECARVLRAGGLLILTTPDPFMERLASALGILKDAGHQETFDLVELAEMVSASGFEVLEKRKFMFSPIGFPAEKAIERVLGPLGLRHLMANQLVVARKNG